MSNVIDSLCEPGPADRTVTWLRAGETTAWLDAHPSAARWLQATGFRAEPGRHAFVPQPHDAVALLAVAPTADTPWSYGAWALEWPERRYVMHGVGADEASAVALGWALGAYQYTRYKAARRAPAQLAWPAAARRDEVKALAGGVALARDLINTPAEDLGPDELVQTALDLAAAFGGQGTVIRGDALRAEGYAALHAVGRASPRAPALVDLRWGAADDPLVSLVGKGICFDTGGLDLKSHDGMLEMKKDMAGAAVVLGLAHALMAMRMPIRLRVLIPAADNVVAGNAMRPRDVLRMRNGKTVEVGFTDAEGRLVLADALDEAGREAPELLIDVATLTGAAKVALGPDVAALFTPDETLAAELHRAGVRANDPLWRLPLWQPYRRRFDSPIADMNNVAKGLTVDAIVAALFLAEFSGGAKAWAHLDIMAFNATARPGRPEGGEAQGLLALYMALKDRYAG